MNDEKWDDIIAYLHDRCEEKGEILSIETFIGCLQEHWETIIKPKKMKGMAKQRELRCLKEQCQCEEDNRIAMTQRISELENEIKNVR